VASYRFIQLDVFTDRALCGNPLAVFPEAEGLTDEELLKIAREMNLSETVFVAKPKEVAAEGETKPEESKQVPDSAGGDTRQTKVWRRLRIYTPAREIPFAGHPVVGIERVDV